MQKLESTCSGFTGHKAFPDQEPAAVCSRDFRWNRLAGGSIHSWRCSMTIRRKCQRHLEADAQCPWSGGWQQASADGSDREIAETGAGFNTPFYEQVKEIPGIIVYGVPAAKCHAPIVPSTLPGRSARVADALRRIRHLRPRGAHCAPLMHRALGTVGQRWCGSVFAF